MSDHTCEWCKKLFVDKARAVKYCSFLCRDLAKGKEMGDKWVKAQRSEVDEAGNRKTRARCLVKLNNVIKFHPCKRVRIYRNDNGKFEI